MSVFVGIDWGSQFHQVCVRNEAGETVEEFTVPHSGKGIASIFDHLDRTTRGDLASVRIAIEVPRGPIVEAALERGLAVYSINPKQLDRIRDRYSAAGAKDDRRDAFVLADGLRLGDKAFRELQPEDPFVIHLREWNRIDEEARQGFTREANRLRDLLLRYYPQMLELVPAADEPWLWDLLDRAPTPDRAARLRRASVQRILEKHRIRRYEVPQVLRILRAPAVSLVPGSREALSRHARTLLPRLRLFHAELRTAEKNIGSLIRERENEEEKGEHRDIRILRSCDGVGMRVAAAMLVEAGQALRSRDYQNLRLLSGRAPVTRQSGKKRIVQRRYACNRRLANAVHHWARINSQIDPYHKDYYRRLRARGHSHGQALRTVGDRLLRVLVSLLEKQELYIRGYENQKTRASVA